MIDRDRGLDALNALVASSQTGFGAFVAVYLTSQAWTQADIGLALSVGTIAAMVSQLPAGALVDAMRSKRLAIAIGGIAVALSALLFAASSAWASVMAAKVLHGFASCMIGPAIAAVSLELAGRRGLGLRLGRNARFASLGSAAAAVILGGIGTYVSGQAV
ncbi:MAG: MFS transporter, partial [Gemmatimonadaceae bacterium]|nr:MFS transporter [Acetobacteraceae bacterium]